MYPAFAYRLSTEQLTSRVKINVHINVIKQAHKIAIVYPF